MGSNKLLQSFAYDQTKVRGLELSLHIINFVWTKSTLAGKRGSNSIEDKGAV